MAVLQELAHRAWTVDPVSGGQAPAARAQDACRGAGTRSAPTPKPSSGCDARLRSRTGAPTGILAQDVTSRRRQPVKPAAQIDRLRRHVDPNARRQRQHDQDSITRTTRANSSSSNSRSRQIRRPPRTTTATPPSPTAPSRAASSFSLSLTGWNHPVPAAQTTDGAVPPSARDGGQTPPAPGHCRTTPPRSPAHPLPASTGCHRSRQPSFTTASWRVVLSWPC